MRLRHKIFWGSGAAFILAMASLAIVMSYDSPCGSAPPAASSSSMKASVYRCYGSPAVIRLEEIPKPPTADDRVIVKIRAASVNPIDWHYLHGTPYFIRLLGVGIGVPEDIHLGIDFAGTVAEVGRKVTRFKPGDAVFGSGDGAFAQYISVREAGALTLKPDNISFEQAAAVPVAAVTALQALREKGHVQAGQRVLINGASGGVGTFAVQIAKAYGADVTAVCSTRNVALVRSIGADRAIDYTREDFTVNGAKYDLIIDTVGNHSPSELRHALSANGAVVMVGGQESNPWMFATLGRYIRVIAMRPFISQRFLGILAEQDQDNLGTLSDLLKSGKIVPVIDRRYSLNDVPEAIRYLEQGHARGKVVIAVDTDGTT